MTIWGRSYLQTIKVAFLFNFLHVIFCQVKGETFFESLLRGSLTRLICAGSVL